jgi:hypothetical protein
MCLVAAQNLIMKWVTFRQTGRTDYVVISDHATICVENQVARFSLVHVTKTGKNVPNEPKWL